MINKISLSQNYQNPFKPKATINYSLQKGTRVSLSVFDETGKVVKNLVSAYQDAGTHSVAWDATDEKGARVPSGTYIYQVSTEEFCKSATMVLLK